MFALGARTFIHSGRRGRSATARDLSIAASLRVDYGVIGTPHGAGMLIRLNIARLPARPAAETVNGLHSVFVTARRTVNRPIRFATTRFVTCRPFAAARSVTRSAGAKPRPATTTGLASTSAIVGLAFADPADERVVASNKSNPSDIENLTARVIAAKNSAARKAISPFLALAGEQAFG